MFFGRKSLGINRWDQEPVIKQNAPFFIGTVKS